MLPDGCGLRPSAFEFHEISQAAEVLRMKPSYSLDEIAETVGGTVRGDGTVKITGVADLATAMGDQITWVTSDKYASKLESSAAGAALVAAGFGSAPMPVVLCNPIERSVAKLLGMFALPASRPEPGIHPTAVIHEAARIGTNPSIGPHVVIDAGVEIGACCLLHAGVFIGRDTTVGDECEFWPNVVIRDGCVIGSRVIIHGNAVIGSDGLGYYFDEGRHHKVPHVGGVVIEDDVEIGACSCVDRAKFGNTVVGRGSKLDNLVQIAHNVTVGQHSIFAALSGVAGSSHVGSYVYFGGQAGVIDNISIGDRVRLGAKSLATRNVNAGTMISGIPAQRHRKELRENAAIRRLPALAALVKDLQARVAELEAALSRQPDSETVR